MKLHIMLSVSCCLVGGAAAQADAQAQGGPPAPVTAPAPISSPAPVAPATPPAPPEDPSVAAASASSTSSASVTPVPSTPFVPPPGTSVPPERVSSQFLSLDRQDGVSRIGVELGFVSVDSSDSNELNPLRIGLYGQYVAPTGLGGYGALNISRISGDGDSATGLGNLELGGIFSGKLGTIEGVARFGVALPTASDDDFADLVANVLGSYSRITDVVHALPNTTWIRVSGSPVIRRQGLTVRADFGADIPVAAEDDIDADPVLHVSLAGGLVAGQHQVSLELVNLFFMGDETERLSSIGGSYRFDLGSATPYFGVFKPFGSDGDLDELTLTLVAGVSGTIDPS